MIAKKTWNEVRGMTFAYAGILMIMLLQAIVTWPETREAFSQKGFLRGLMTLVPIQTFQDSFRDFGQAAEPSAYAAYIAVQHFFKGCNIVGIACAVLIGTGAIARERESGTLEFLLSRPVSRSRVLWGKFWVLALAVVVPIFVSSAAILPLSLLVGQEPSLGPLMHASFHASVFILAFLALTLWFSSLFKAQVHVAFAIGGVIVIQASMYFVQFMREGSLFMLADYATYGPIVAGNGNFERLFWSTEIWLLLATLILYVLTDRTLRRADI